MLRINNKRLAVLINILTGMTTGPVLSFIVAMDNLNRGELSVSSDSYKLIYVRLMNGASEYRQR